MTNKKFKLAAMSLALTACVAASPLSAGAEAPEAAADVHSPLPLPTLPPRTSRPRKRLLRKNPPPKLPRTLWKKRLPRAPRNLPLRSRKPPPPGMRRSCLPCPGRARWW